MFQVSSYQKIKKSLLVFKFFKYDLQPLSMCVRLNSKCNTSKKGFWKRGKISFSQILEILYLSCLSTVIWSFVDLFIIYKYINVSQFKLQNKIPIHENYYPSSISLRWIMIFLIDTRKSLNKVYHWHSLLSLASHIILLYFVYEWCWWKET